MKKLTSNIKVVILASILALGVSSLYAWTGPTATAPNGNVSAPINVGLNSQSKLGQLFLNTSLSNPYAIGLSVFGQSIFNGPVQITSGTPGVGKVLTSVDASGTVAWTSAGSSGASASSSGIVFIPPTSLISTSANVPWTTMSGLQADAVPTSASMVVLQFDVHAPGSSGASGAQMQFRASSGGSVYQTSLWAGANNQDGLIQVLVPVVSSGGNLSFDYMLTNSFSANTTLTLIGYITGNVNAIIQPSRIIAGNDITISSDDNGNVTVNAASSITSSGSVSGGWYYTSVTATNNTFTSWGNAIAIPTTIHSGFFTVNTTVAGCPSGYTAEGIAPPTTGSAGTGNNNAPMAGLCIKN